jgi:hypothetical protein
MPDLEGFIRGWGTRLAADAGLADGRIAEGFFISEMPG